MIKTQTQPSHSPLSKYDKKIVLTRTETDNGQTNELENELVRLKTFDGCWNNNKIRPETLAKAGFYFLKKGDAVKCPFCKVEGCQWESDDDPMQDHIKWAPNCMFVQQIMANGSSTSSSNSVGSLDECGSREFLPNSGPEDETFKLLKIIGVEKTKPCSYEQYNNIESRLKSFSEWPKSLKQKPAKLAEAGFFYKGTGDQTLCFHCGGGLKDWEDDDDPWEQHACWFPACNFLQLCKGKEFVEQVQKRFNIKSTRETIATKENNDDDEQVVAKSVEVEQQKTNKTEDINKVDDTRLCKICFKNELGVVFIPCGHVVACVDCSMSLKNVCPVCRKRFETSVRAFLQ